MSTDKTFKIEPLNDELIEAIDVEIWSPEQPKWFIDWFSNKSDAESILNLDEIDWILKECEKSLNYSKKLMDENNNEETKQDFNHTLENTNLIKNFFKNIIQNQN